ncbi:DeoR/GlpR family DNA-binding transcription regulator [Halocella sp. SP3-1]|uniref:DeoR/GlpR family DNA-binding transcription regulator n=1 Tax=Halocella sp. SP3-1 TaxID=2382161 RepID=UPI000F7625E0|nr:DeoR/GlpR family DNA-binding transcription regulator [Halocella sp. SP3-1]AZO94511.1 DeoR/GlpR transcriptional regulator [Halocella sp. SP3-1]
MPHIKERRNKILEILAKNGHVKSTELMEILNTSRETVRRDLNALSKKGLLVKTYGGATTPENKSSGFIPLQAREKSHLVEKQALCSHAARAIKEYDTIFLDNSSTVMHIIQYIPKQYHITFITNSIRLLTEFAILHNQNWHVISLGGALDYGTYSTNRYLTINNLRNFKPNKAFLSCHGIDEDFTVTETRMDDVEIKKYIVETCQETYLLTDYSKLPSKGVIKVTDAANFEGIITNDNADALFLSHLHSHGCQVQLAPTKNKSKNS